MTLNVIRYRQRQIKELVKFVNKSDADFVLLGGDFNVDPKASRLIQKITANTNMT